MKYAGFSGPSYTSLSKVAAADRSVNWYTEKIESGTGKTDFAQYPCPGWSLYCTLPTTPFRPDFYTLNGSTFAVGGDVLYQLPFSVGGTPVARATGLHNVDNGRVTLAGNGDAGFQLVYTSQSRIYCLNLQTSVNTPIADISATVVHYQNGYFIGLDPNRSEINLAFGDGTVWDALDVSQRGDRPDKWIAMLPSHNELWLFGLQTTSVYYLSDDPDLPWIPNPSVFIPYGIYAPDSAANVSGTPMWLGQGEDGGLVVFRAQGYSAVRVSNHAIEHLLSTYTQQTAAKADVYQEMGHVFYVLRFPNDPAVVYDATTGLWHERGQGQGLDFGPYPVVGHTFMNGRHLVGDPETGNIYIQDASIATDLTGAGMVRVRRAPHVFDQEGLRNVRYSRLQVDLETGLGLVTGQGSDPQLMLRYSDDGGQSFGNEMSTSAGMIGDYLATAEWFMLGQSRDRVFELRVSDPIPWRLLGAYIDASVGRS